VQQPVLDDVGGGAGEIAEQSKAADAPDVPEELDLLQPHRGDACRRADDQDQSAGTGAWLRGAIALQVQSQLVERLPISNLGHPAPKFENEV
jgi:hypothetical protein